MILTALYYSYISNSIDSELTVGLSNSLKVIDTAGARMIDERISDMLSWKTMSIPEVCFEYNRPEAMQVFLDRIKNINNSYSYIVAYRPDGTFFASSSINSGRYHKTRLLGKIVKNHSNHIYSVDFIDLDNQTYILITSPLYNRINEHIGFISAYLKWSVFDNIFNEYRTTKIDINGYVKNKQSLIELFYDKNLEAVNFTAKSMNFNKGAIKAATVSNHFYVHTHDDVDFAMTCTRMEHSAMSNITHCFAIDKDIALSSLKFVRNKALIIAMVSLIVITLASFFITKNLLKPFQEIFDVLMRYKEGSVRKNKKNVLPFMDLNSMKATIINLIGKVIQSESLKIDKEAVEAKAKAKSLFLANMSHEIRTPLNTILGYSELLKDEMENGRQCEYIDNIVSSGHMLLDLVNEILDFSKIEKGKIKLNHEPMSLLLVLKEIEKHFSDKMKSKGLAFNVSAEPVFDSLIIKCDKTRFKQILLNLIGNAYKFTDIGYVKIHVKKTSTGNDYISFAISVEDSGIGMDDTKKIFHEFEQLPQPSEKVSSGSGLGLAIVHRLIKMFDGDLSVESVPNKGSKFVVKFNGMKIVDRIKCELSNHYIEQPNIDQVEFYPATIIVADDNKKNRDLICDFLEPYRISISTAKNGKEAIQLAEKINPNLIIMDLKMPVMDGFEATKIIKSTDALKNIRIITLTADITERTKKNIISIGSDGLLLKPISRKTLFDELKKYLPYMKKDIAIGKRDDTLYNIENLFDGNRNKELFFETKKIKETKWSKVSKTMIIGDMEVFANDVSAIGEKYNYEPLVSWGRNLAECSKNFNIKKINQIFSQFPEIVRRLEVAE